MNEKQVDLFDMWEAESQQQEFGTFLAKAEAGDKEAQMLVGLLSTMEEESSRIIRCCSLAVKGRR
jgi:hypothetical protein